MKTLIAAVVVVLLGFLSFSQGTAFGQGYVVPTVVQSYYPVAPVYTPYVAPVVLPARRYVYAPVVAAPAPVMVPAPVVVPAPVWVGPPAVVIRGGRVYIPGQPVRNVVRAVLPY